MKTYQIESSFVPVVLPANLDEVDNVLVVEQLQDPYFSERSDGEALFLIVHQDLLQRYDLRLVRLESGLEHLAEGSLPNLGHLLVFVHLGAVQEVVLLDVLVPVLGGEHGGAGAAGAAAGATGAAAKAGPGGGVAAAGGGLHVQHAAHHVVAAGALGQGTAAAAVGRLVVLLLTGVMLLVHL